MHLCVYWVCFSHMCLCAGQGVWTRTAEVWLYHKQTCRVHRRGQRRRKRTAENHRTGSVERQLINMSDANQSELDSCCIGLDLFSQDAEGVPIDVKMKSKGDNVYSCSYTPSSAVKHTLAVTWGGVSVPNSPFRVRAAETVITNTEETSAVSTNTLEQLITLTTADAPNTSAARYKPLIIITTAVMERLCYSVRWLQRSVWISMRWWFGFTFSHLADAFIQSDLQLGST